MNTILETIVAHKRRELAERRAATPLEALRERADDATPGRGFADALQTAAAAHPAIVAEIKRGSPSLGCIRPDLDPAELAGHYRQGGAAALSVLTDQPFFFGSDTDFLEARRGAPLPMLRKDFIIDPYQVYESRLLGADCILVILAILDDPDAAALTTLARNLGMDVLVETHTEEEVRRAVAHCDFSLLGINNRDLKTFKTDLAVTEQLAEAAPDRDRLVAESGLHHPEDVQRLWTCGVRRFLIGEAFVRSGRPAETVHQFVSACTA